MSLRRFVLFLLSASLVVAACTTPQPTATPEATTSPTDVPRFETADCWFDEPSGQTVECGYLIVPEDRSRPAGKTIRLAVARFKSDASAPEPDPIVYLEGGPGGSPLRGLVRQFNVLFGPLLEKRDLILFDQRGTGYSEPALDCPEYKEFTLDVLDDDLTIEQAEKLSDQALLKCRDRLAGDGVNLAAYTSAESAADLADLRKALEIEQWNLYGISYGTRLALTAMRDFPQGIRSVVIDSVYPPQVDLFASIPANAERAFDVLFAACAADSKCDADYPELRDTFFDLVRQINDKPITFPVKLNSGESYPALTDGDGMMGMLFQSLYATSLIPFLPRLIYEVRDGNTALLAALEGEFLSQLDDISSGMQYSVQCGEEAPFTTLQALRQFTDADPRYRAFASPGVYALCQKWGAARPQPVENEPVTSDIPTLVLGGEFDPITPPDWARMTADTLSNSFIFELPGAGHGASLTVECPREMLLAFLDAPTTAPDSSCIAEKMSRLEFAPPVADLSVEMVPFEAASLQIAGLVPDGWVEISPGAYTPKGELTDQTALIQQAAPLAPQAFLRFFETQLKQSGVDAVFEEVERRRANGLDWTIYSVTASIAVVDLALAEKDGVTYVIVFQSLIDEHAAWYEAVFLAAVEGLRPLGR